MSHPDVVSTLRSLHFSGGDKHSIITKKFTYLQIVIRAVKDKNRELRDFPGGAVVKNPPANAGDTGSSPGLGRSHMPRSN